MKQFLDDKSYRPGLQTYKREELGHGNHQEQHRQASAAAFRRGRGGLRRAVLARRECEANFGTFPYSGELFPGQPPLRGSRGDRLSQGDLGASRRCDMAALVVPAGAVRQAIEDCAAKVWVAP